MPMMEVSTGRSLHPSAIRAELNKNERITFYTRYGDYLGRMATFVTVILLLYALLQKYARKEA